jgi:hypothetical protein
MPTKSLPRAKAGVGIHVFSDMDSDQPRRKASVFTPGKSFLGTVETANLEEPWKCKGNSWAFLLSFS